MGQASVHAGHEVSQFRFISLLPAGWASFSGLDGRPIAAKAYLNEMELSAKLGSSTRISLPSVIFQGRLGVSGTPQAHA